MSQYFAKGGGRGLMNRYESFRASHTSSLDMDIDDIISPELREQVCVGLKGALCGGGR